MLPDEGQLPQCSRCSKRLQLSFWRGLTKLARLCEAARCQPLEVFTRSVHCTTHSAALESMKAKGRVYEQQRMQTVEGHHGAAQCAAAVYANSPESL